MTSDPYKTALDAYPSLVEAIIKAMDFLKVYKSTLSRDVAATLMWVGRDDSDAVSSCDISMKMAKLIAIFQALPEALQQYQKTGNTDYSIDSVMLSQVLSDFQQKS